MILLHFCYFVVHFFTYVERELVVATVKNIFCCIYTSGKLTLLRTANSKAFLNVLRFLAMSVSYAIHSYD